MVVEGLSFIKALIDIAALKNSKLAVLARACLQPVITVFFLGLVYLGSWVIHTGSLVEGFKAAFIDNNIAMLQRKSDIETALLQAELKQTAVSEALVNKQLTALLHLTPNAARIRVAVIHNGVVGTTGISILRYDTTTVVANSGRVPGPFIVNQPLKGWVRTLPSLLAGECVDYPTADIEVLAERERVESMGTLYILTCPVMDINHQLLGSMFIHWDVLSEVPVGKAMERLKEEAKSTGRQVAIALDLRQHIR